MEGAQKHGTRRPVPEAVAKLVSTRSRTDSEKSELSTTRSRLRNALPAALHHTNNADKQHHSHMRAAKETVQSALELRPPISFDHLLRRDKKPVPSRHNSSNGAARGADALSKPQRSTLALKEYVGIEGLNKARKDNEEREEELRNSLQQVEEQGMQSTRELDTTYYILLEKAEALRDIVSSMQQVAKASRSLQQDFSSQSTALRIESTRTIAGYEEFNKQESSIRQLLDQLESYRSRTTNLNTRLHDAKYKADICERRIIQAQAQRRKRWSITWAILFAIVVTILGILIAKNHTSILDAASEERVESDIRSPLLTKLKTKTEDVYLQSLFDGIS